MVKSSRGGALAGLGSLPARCSRLSAHYFYRLRNEGGSKVVKSWRNGKGGWMRRGL